MNALQKYASWLMAGGAALILFSLVWPWLVSGRSAHTEEDAKAYQQNSMDVHNRLHARAHKGQDDGHQHADGDLEEAKKRFEESLRKVDAAASRGKLPARIAQVMGALCLIAGALMLWINQPQ